MRGSCPGLHPDGAFREGMNSREIGNFGPRHPGAAAVEDRDREFDVDLRCGRGFDPVISGLAVHLDARIETGRCHWAVGWRRKVIGHVMADFGVPEADDAGQSLLGALRAGPRPYELPGMFDVHRLFAGLAASVQHPCSTKRCRRLRCRVSGRFRP